MANVWEQVTPSHSRGPVWDLHWCEGIFCFKSPEKLELSNNYG